MKDTKKNIKKVFCSLLAVVMLVTSVSVGIFATDGDTFSSTVTNNTYTFEITDSVEKTVMITKCTEGTTNFKVEIPAEVVNDNTTYTVTAIGEEAFKDATFNALVIPDTVTRIYKRAFYNNTNLVDLTIPDSVNYMEDYNFYNCTSLKTLNIGSGLAIIYGSSFYNCSSLESLDVPDTIVDLRGFGLCSSLESVSLPENLYRLSAFTRCTSLTSINIPDSIEYSTSGLFFDNCPWWVENKANYTDSKGFIVIGDGVLIKYTGTDTSVVIPDTVKYVMPQTFQYSPDVTAITDITIGHNVKGLYEGSFWGLNTRYQGFRLKVPTNNNLTYLEKGCFWIDSFINGDENSKVLIDGDFTIPATAAVIESLPSYTGNLYCYKGTAGEWYLQLRNKRISNSVEYTTLDYNGVLPYTTNDSFVIDNDATLNYDGFEDWQEDWGKDGYQQLTCPKENATLEYAFSAAKTFIDQNVSYTKDGKKVLISTNDIPFFYFNINENNADKFFDTEKEAFNYYSLSFLGGTSAYKANLGDGLNFCNLSVQKFSQNANGKYYASFIQIIPNFYFTPETQAESDDISYYCNATKSYSNSEYGRLFFQNEMLNAMNIYKAEGTIYKTHSSVCKGFAQAQSSILSILGYEFVSGGGSGNTGGHIYNIVKINNSWIIVDATADSTFYSNSVDILHSQATLAFGYVDTGYSSGIHQTSAPETLRAEKLVTNYQPISLAPQFYEVEKDDSGEYTFNINDFAKKYFRNCSDYTLNTQNVANISPINQQQGIWKVDAPCSDSSAKGCEFTVKDIYGNNSKVYQTFTQAPDGPIDITSEKDGWNIATSNTTISYNNNSNVPALNITNADGQKLVEGKDYQITYTYYGPNGIESFFSSNYITDVGKYKMTIYPINSDYTGSVEKEFVVKPAKVTGLTNNRVTNSIVRLTWNTLNSGNTVYYIYMYNSKTKKYEYKTKTSSTTKTITNLSPGKKYQFKVRAKVENNLSIVGDYSSSYYIATKPNETNNKKITGGKKKIVYDWATRSSATGYQVVYKLKGKSYKSITISGCKNSKKTIKNLKPGTYYVKVRCYKTYTDANGKTKKVYSDYTSAKKVVVKK